MTKDENFNLLKVQTFVLKVSIHCDGCKQKVKKLLQRIEGVYTVRIEAEQQRVTVTGNVNSATLIKKLARSGKHAELWPQKTSIQNSKPNPQVMKNGGKGNNDKGSANHGLIQGLKAFKDQQAHKLDSFISDDDDDVAEDADELRLLTEKMNQINLIRQQVNNNAAKKNGSNGGGGKMGGGGGNPNQNAANVKTSGGANPISVDGKRAGEMNGLMMGVGGIQGLGFHQAQQQQQQQQQQVNRFIPTGYSSNGPPATQVMQGLYQSHPSSTSMMMMNNLQRSGHGGITTSFNNSNNNVMAYNRSPQIPHYTGYYSYPSPYLNLYQQQPGVPAAHPISDEAADICAVM